jgi:transposase-like protein
MPADVDWPSQGKSDAGVLSVRKACPACGRPMKAVPDEVAHGELRYVCTGCDDDPLRDLKPASGRTGR